VIGAVNIGGTRLAVGVVDDNGKVLSRLEFRPTLQVVTNGLAND